MTEHDIRVQAAGAELAGTLAIPPHAAGVVLFAHGSGSSRFSPRNRAVAARLRDGGLATLLVDLLTAQEERVDVRTAELRFDIALLTDRLAGAVAWLAGRAGTAALPIGLFGSSTGAAAALAAAARRPDLVAAVVSRGGRPDLAGADLARVRAPTLLIVGGEDDAVLGLNRQALAGLGGIAALDVVPGAGHLFEEPGALERVADLARDWFLRWLGARAVTHPMPP